MRIKLILKMKSLIEAYLIMIVIVLSSHVMALDLTHWDENKVRSSNTTIWYLLSVKCGNVSNPAKKPNCDKQIQKWKNQREMTNQEDEKPVQIISANSNGRFKVVHNEYGTQKIKKFNPGIQKSRTQIRNTGGINKFHGYRIK